MGRCVWGEVCGEICVVRCVWGDVCGDMCWEDVCGEICWGDLCGETTSRFLLCRSILSLFSSQTLLSNAYRFALYFLMF